MPDLATPLSPIPPVVVDAAAEADWPLTDEITSWAVIGKTRACVYSSATAVAAAAKAAETTAAGGDALPSVARFALETTVKCCSRWPVE